MSSPNCPWPEIDALDPRTAIEVTPAGGWYAATKGAVDFALAVALLVPGLPVMLACWVAVKLTSRGPGFYTQTRYGRFGKTYRIVKLRTMTVDAERHGAVWATKRDCRVTPVGRFLRKTHLDELPQLFNVLLGQMSLVGPRPERPEIITAKKLAEHVPGYHLRLLVKPGVTGLAQLQLPPDEDLNSVRYKVVYDLFYVENSGTLLDLRLLAATAMKAVGVGPTWLRRLFFLPRKETVVAVFRDNSNPPSKTYTSLQPA